MSNYPITLMPHGNLSKRMYAAACPITQYGQSKGFRASSLSGCLRQVGYRVLGHAGEQGYNPDWDIAAAMGSTVHLHMQRQLVLAGLCIHLAGHRVPPDLRAILPTEWHDASLEVPLDRFTHPDQAAWRKDVGFSGHIDAVLRMTDGTLGLFDLKTTASKYIDPGYRYLPEKLDSYFTQVNSYLHFFATPEGERARRAWVLMLSRDDTSRRLLYRIDYDAEAWAVDQARLEAAKAAVDAGQLPEPEPARGCRFCSYKAQCPGYRP